MWDDYFKGKKITLMGLGLLGRGIGDARFLARHGANLIVTDLKTKEQLASSLQELQEFSNITYRLGEHSLEDFKDRDMIIKGAGVPLDSTFIAEAQAHNIPVEMSTSLFARLFLEYKKSIGKGDTKCLIGITGSKGKTTTTYLIFEILTKGFPNARVRLGGNIQGVSTLAYLDDLQPDDIFVLELDSWQLQGFGESKLSPHISVFTNLLPDHLNYYRGDMDMYFKDKSNIFCFQDEKNVCFVGPTILPWAEKHTPAHTLRLKTPTVDSIEKKSRSLAGKHNDENIALAVAVAREMGVSEDIITKTIETFEGVPGRLQFVGEKNGVAYYNDTTATMPDAVLAAIRALGEKKNIVLIMGGADKQIDATALVAELPKFCKTLVLFKGTGTDKVRHLIDDSEFESVTEVGSMTEAVTKANEVARAGDIILLSPAFASFGMFINEYDRGDQFNSAVKQVS